MSAMQRAMFVGFDPYKLTGVRMTDRKLGHGSYATVLELEYMGLKCAGKKIHELLLEQGDASYTVRRFEEECRLLSQIRHPNIVQFLGVFFQQGVRTPILVMEFLPTNLTSCIEQHSILPKEIGYSILHDVALGLCYLHNQTPPIIHRDLSSNNVLLTPNMTAKISDLGVARILNLTPLQVSHMTQTPGTPAYMPPEVMIANPKYDTSVDEFSYGIMMIHMFSGRWPEPQVGQVRTELDGRMIPVSEAERREVFLRTIGNDHPLMDLILKCIHNHPQARPHASEIVKQLADLVLHFPTSFSNRLDEALRQIEIFTKDNRDLRREIRIVREEMRVEIERKNVEIQELRAENQQLKIENRTADLSLQESIPFQADITYKQCAELPIGINYANTTVLDVKVYCGGGMTDHRDDEYIVYCYDPSRDEWTTLPPLPVKWFGLGQVNGKLVAIGGLKKSAHQATNEICTYNQQSRKWKQEIPPMPTVRWSPGVFSLQSALIVAGGYEMPTHAYTAVVEVFKPGTSQWYRTAPLPTPCQDVSVITISNTCYALGGYNGSLLNQALYASVDDLLGSAVPANQITRSDSTGTQPAWKTLPDTPTYRPATAMLSGNLLAVGGGKTFEGGGAKKEVYMYSPSTTSWVYISNLPAPRSRAAVALLSSAESILIGGYHNGSNMNTVYKLNGSQIQHSNSQ